MTPNEKALKVLDLLLAKFNLTKETCPLGTFIESYTTLHQAKFCRPRGTLVEDYGMLAFIRYNGLIVARYDESTEMSDEIAKAVDDPRPLQSLKPIQCPYWITGYTQDDDHNFTAAIIVCYLPTGTDPRTYWDDAHEVETTETDEITYSSHFPKPDWLA